MLPAASDKNKTKLPAKIIQLPAREESPKTSKQDIKPVTNQVDKPEKKDNPFADWIMPPQPTGYDKGSDYEFY